MKNWLYLSLIAVLSSCQLPAQSSKTERSEVIKKEINTGSAGKLYIRNITGSLDIQGYEGDKIMIEVTKSLKAKSPDKLESSWAETDLGIVQKGNTILLYAKSPCTNPAIGETDPENWDEWNILYIDNCKWKYNGEAKLDFIVKVPRAFELSIATVNDGDIIIKEMKNAINVNNVNGGIQLENIAGVTEARTVNGDVTINYTKNPDGNSYYYTLNGNINANFKKELSANLYFKSYQGDFYTDLDDNIIEALPVQVEKATESKGVTYKVGGTSGLKVRNGGPKLEFETFNGNVYIKEQ